MYRIFARKLFGVKYERLYKTMLIWLLVFYGLYLADYRVQIAPSILYLMISSFTAGVMWQALASKANAENMENLLMLPFQEKRFVFAYVSALGIYTLLTKTAGLIAVVLAVSPWSGTEVMGSVLCAVNAIAMTACIYTWRKRGQCDCGTSGESVGNEVCSTRRGSAVNTILCICWGGAVIAVIFLFQNNALFLLVIMGNFILAGLLLPGADAYSFYCPGSGDSRTARSGRYFLVWRYLFRYLAAHRNYLVNTAVMWGVACVLPHFLGRMDGISVMPIGFAVLSLNTPICILLSCDPDLEQAVRFLPGQKKAFCVPYCLFIFLCNMAADAIFLASWHVMNGKWGMGGMTEDVNVILTAIFFALQSAVGSVLLEWFYPIRGWKIESDLWHHPRKYIVPAAMLLLAFLFV